MQTSHLLSYLKYVVKMINHSIISVDLVDKAIEILRQNNVEVDDLGLDKISHDNPPKTLRQHIMECIDISRRILSMLFSNSTIYPELEKFLSLLCLLHDLGKLNPNWKPGSSVPHSNKSIEYIETIRKYSDIFKDLVDEKLYNLLLYFIQHHHAKLKYPCSFSEANKIKWINSRKNKEKAIIYADVFGVFKLADYASASGLRNYILENMVLDIDPIRIINGMVQNIDQNKLELQKQIAYVDEDHVFLTAPTGWGKTVVALLRIAKTKPLKVFYVLPTITAIRKLRDKISRTFQSIKNIEIGEYFYFADVDLLIHRDFSEKSEIIDLYKYFIPSFNFTTIDQLIITMLKTGKYYMRRLAFRKSLIVIDEYHLLTPQMIGVLKAIIEFYLDNYNFKLLFMTATPQKSYARHLREKLGSNAYYFEDVRLFNKPKRHSIEFITDQTIEDAIQDKMDKILSKDNRVLIIVNTVDKAVNIYRLLKEYMKNQNQDIVLLHSRFSIKDRYEKELLINRSKILVSTQVSEVSLDIDFDILLTEIAPLPALIQRMGRVNRYGLKRLMDPNVYILYTSDPRPYTSLEIEQTKYILNNFLEKLNNASTEEIFLKVVEEYDKGFANDKIQKYYRITKEVLEMNPLTSLEDKDLDIIRELRDNANIMAIPYIYENLYLNLYNKLRTISSYSEKIKIMAEIKSLLVPIPIYLINKYGFSKLFKEEADLPYPIVGGDNTLFRYSNEYGLYKESI